MDGFVGWKVFQGEAVKAKEFDGIEAEVSPRDPCDVVDLLGGKFVAENVRDSASGFCAAKANEVVSYGGKEPAE